MNQPGATEFFMTNIISTAQPEHGFLVIYRYTLQFSN